VGGDRLKPAVNTASVLAKITLGRPRVVLEKVYPGQASPCTKVAPDHLIALQ
jgi:hypothetical protein